jgi:transcriptional regulator with XRE-family HTH domain
MNLSHLKKLLVEHGITQTDLARILGRDKSVITNLFQGKRQLKAEEAMQIASVIGVPVTQILGMEQPASLMEPGLLIPFQHEPQHGKRHKHVVKKDGKYFLEMDAGMASTPNAFALEVADDSLNLSGILRGDVVISRLDEPCKAGQAVIVQHYQGRGATTLLRKYEPPFLVPHSTSPAHPTFSTEKDDVRLVSPVLRLMRIF